MITLLKTYIYFSQILMNPLSATNFLKHCGKEKGQKMRKIIRYKKYIIFSSVKIE